MQIKLSVLVAQSCLTQLLIEHASDHSATNGERVACRDQSTIWEAKRMSSGEDVEVLEQSDDGISSDELMDDLVESISAEEFSAWYQEREFAKNIRAGRAYFNGPSQIKPPEKYSPSSLLQCHRKTTYKELNAPEERGDPQGIFWFGDRFEQDIILSFFQDAVVGSNQYVTNSVWVDFRVDTAAGELCIKGETDPVIVDGDAKPILLTEIKTTKSVENLQGPKTHHEAQAHAYMMGLSEKYARDVKQAIILYGSRETLDIKAFHIEYDPYFWRETVLDWASTHTSYRLDEELPPDNPEWSWECQFCSFRERCGRGEMEYTDTGPIGLLPLYSDYPRQKVVDYLKAHDGSKLTPTLANRYPDLASEYGVFDWHCSDCNREYEWTDIEWYSQSSKPPECPACQNDRVRSWLRGPAPGQQHSGGENND